MNWLNFLQKIQNSDAHHHQLPEDSKILFYLLSLDNSIYDFKSQQDSESLHDCFYFMVLVADFFNLPLSDIMQNIYDDVAYKFVNHQRLTTNMHGLSKLVLRSIQHNTSLNKKSLHPFSYGLSRALIDCAYAYGWTPSEIMKNENKD